MALAVVSIVVGVVVVVAVVVVVVVVGSGGGVVDIVFEIAGDVVAVICVERTINALLLEGVELLDQIHHHRLLLLSSVKTSVILHQTLVHSFLQAVIESFQSLK